MSVGGRRPGSRGRRGGASGRRAGPSQGAAPSAVCFARLEKKIQDARVSVKVLSAMIMPTRKRTKEAILGSWILPAATSHFSGQCNTCDSASEESLFSCPRDLFNVRMACTIMFRSQMSRGLHFQLRHYHSCVANEDTSLQLQRK